MEEKPVVVITGASSGIGREACKLFLSNGYMVYGVARSETNIEGVKNILCDVSDRAAVYGAVEQIIAESGRIDVLINNAGFGISGNAEMSALDDIKRIMDVNFFGAVNFTQCVLPYMRRDNGGLIINTNSVGGFIPLPFQSFYSASKFALDGFMRSLYLEVKPYNINICNLYAADVKTDFTKNREKREVLLDNPYAKKEASAIEKIEHDETHGMKPVKVAQAMLKVALKKNPPIGKVVGFGFNTIRFLSCILPQKFVMKLLAKWYRV